jgi:1-acyl-sn-glycerol-3-phosphate acyltransferase
VSVITSAIEAGDSIFVFAEGTFRRPRGILPFRLGAFACAKHSGTPLTPVVVRGTRTILPSESYLFTPARVEVEILEELRDGIGEGWEGAAMLRDHVREVIGHGTGEPLL